MVSIKIASHKEIRDSRERWDSLVKSMEFPSVFLTWEWIVTWLEHFGGDCKPLILFMYDDADLTGIIPLAMSDMRLPDGLLMTRTIGFCGSVELYPNHLDIICAKDHAKVYAGKMLEFFSCEYKDWDVLHFSFLTEDGSLATYLKSYDGRLRLTDIITAPFLSVHGGIDALLKSFGSKKRYNIHRETKNLFKNKNIVFQRIQEKEDIERSMKDLINLHTERANGKGINTTFGVERVINFHLDLARIFSETGWLRLYALKDNGRAISAAYGFMFEKRFNYYQTGLDMEWSRYSVGKILILKVLEDIIGEGAVEFDFLGGDEEYKAYWTKNVRHNMTYKIYNENLTASFEKSANVVREKIKSFARRYGINKLKEASL